MKKFIFLMMLIIMLPSFKVSNSKVLMYIEDNSMDLGFMLKNEALRMKQILEESGFIVEIATLTGEVLKADSVSLQPDLKLSQVNVLNYEGLILPCMATNDTVITFEERNIIRNIAARNKPIAAQTGAVLILAKSGLLKGKKYAFVESMLNQMQADFEGGVFSGMGVVQDGNIITSGICPMHAKMTGNKDGTTELTNLLVEAIKAKN